VERLPLCLQNSGQIPQRVKAITKADKLLVIVLDSCFSIPQNKEFL
jgi:hypothetical protein